MIREISVWYLLVLSWRYLTIVPPHWDCLDPITIVICNQEKHQLPVITNLQCYADISSLLSPKHKIWPVNCVPSQPVQLYESITENYIWANICYWGPVHLIDTSPVWQHQNQYIRLGNNTNTLIHPILVLGKYSYFIFHGLHAEYKGFARVFSPIRDGFKEVLHLYGSVFLSVVDVPL